MIRLLFIFSCISGLMCTIKEEKTLPRNYCYFEFHHVKEIYDTANNIEKFLRYEIADTELTQSEIDTLTHILKEKNIDFLKVDSNKVLIQFIYLADNLDNIYIIDSELARRHK